MTKAQIYILSFLILMVAVSLYWMSAFNTSKRLYEELDVPAAQYKDILARLPGTYSNTVQYELAPPMHKAVAARRVGQTWIDLQSLSIQPVSLLQTTPDHVRDAFFVQWHDGDITAPIGRQQLWVFGFKDDKISLDIAPVALNTLPSTVSADILGALDVNCTLPLRVVDGEYHFTRPQTCIVPSETDNRLRLTGEITLYDNVSYQEAVLSSEGRLMDEIPGNGRYDFVRVAASED